MIGTYSTQFTVSAADLTRFASNVTGATFTLTETTTGDSLAHQVTVRNDSATDHSAKTIILTGTDSVGAALTETINAPGVSATVTSSKFFLTLTSAVPSATIGADTFDIGIAATARSPWVRLNAYADTPATTIGVTVSGTINYDVLLCLDAPSGNSLTYNHADLTAKTATAYGGLTTPVTGVCVDVNSNTSGVFTLQVVQAG
jgi:hypothetical protein